MDLNRDGATVTLSLEEFEAEVLRKLAGEMRLLLEADLPRTDPVTDRLFPRASEDDEQEETYRSMVGDDLVAYKKEALETLEKTLGSSGPATVALSGEDRERWLTFLADTRLALGTRLEVTEDDMGREPDPDDPSAVALSVLHWVGWVQEQLVAAALEDFPG